MPDPAVPVVHHTVTGIRSTCRQWLRAADAVVHLSFEGVTCPDCLAPPARRRAENILRADLHNLGAASAAWPVRAELGVQA